MKLVRDWVDVGLVAVDREAVVGFYRDLLGLKTEYELPLPDGGVMYRFLCGSAVFKIMVPGKAPAHIVPRTSVPAVTTTEDLVERCVESTGYRFVTITISNIEEVYQACVDAGCKIVYKLGYSRPATLVTVIEDPEGNWVELVEYVDPDAARADLESKDRTTEWKPMPPS